jgi:hypothetical protein
MVKILQICPAAPNWYAVFKPSEYDDDKSLMYLAIACWCLVVDDEEPAGSYPYVDAIEESYDKTTLATETGNFSHFQYGRPSGSKLS